MIVHIKPIAFNKWHGKKGEEDFGEPQVLEVLVGKTGQYDTGLSKEDQARLEEKTGFDLSPKFNPEEAHPFWSRPQGRIKLPKSTLILNTENPLDEIKYHNLKASKYVANSLEDYDNGLYPKATHYIHDDVEQVTRRGQAIQSKMEAYMKLKEMKPKQMDAIAWAVVGLDLSNQSIDYKTAILGEAIEKNPKSFMQAATMDKETLLGTELVLASVYYGNLRQEGNAIYYFQTKIGIDTLAAVNYLNNPQNQDLKFRLVAQLDAKRQS